MNIIYATNKLERILTNERLIRKEYTGFYKKVMNRMSELRAVNNLEEIPHTPPPKRHKLTGDRNKCWGIDVSKNYRIVLRPTDETQEDPKFINEIEIITVEDYH